MSFKNLKVVEQETTRVKKAIIITTIMSSQQAHAIISSLAYQMAPQKCISNIPEKVQ